MASDEPGIQKGGVIALRATTGATFRAAVAIISLSGVNGPRLVCTVRAEQGIISVTCEQIVTAFQPASSVRGVRRGPEGGRIRGQPPLVVIHPWQPLLERVRRYAPGAPSEICETIVTIIQSASFARGVQ